MPLRPLLLLTVSALAILSATPSVAASRALALPNGFATVPAAVAPTGETMVCSAPSQLTLDVDPTCPGQSYMPLAAYLQRRYGDRAVVHSLHARSGSQVTLFYLLAPTDVLDRR